MGIFGFLKGPAPDSDALRDSLFDLVSRGDREALDALCRAEKDAIVANIPDWQKPPQAVRDDPAKLKAYATSLIFLARYLAERLNEPRPLQRLTQPPQDDPIGMWQQALQQVVKLKEELRFEEAENLLASALDRAKDMRGEACDKLLPVTLAWIAECRFQQGKARDAVEPMEQSFQLCEARKDEGGMTSCLANLYEIHRWLGEGEQAAAVAERMADRLEAAGNAEGAMAMRRECRRSWEGKSACRVAVRLGDRVLDVADLPPSIEGNVEFLFLRNRVTLRPAVEALRKGREQGAKGNFDASLVAFREAARLDPFDPDASYLAGLSLLHLRRYSDAVEDLVRAQKLAPGWFQQRSDLWLAGHLASGTIEHGTFLAIRVAEEAALPPEKKLELLDGAIEKAPTVARLRLLRGELLRTMGRAEEAEATLREALARAEEPGVRGRALLHVGLATKDPAERERLLGEARDQQGDLLASAMAAVALRTHG